MSEKPVYIVATVKVKPGQELVGEKMLRGLIAPTHREAGCRRYALHKRTDQPRTYYFIEHWVSHEDVKQHLEAQHIQAALAKKDEWLELLDIAFVEPLMEGDKGKAAIF